MSGDADLGAQISKLLADPAALSQIMSVAGTLMNTMPPAEAPHADTPPAEAPTEKPTEIDLGTALDKPAVKAGASPSMPPMDSILKLLSNVKPSKNDPRCTLLLALKPYLSETRCQRVDALIQALQFAGIAQGFFDSGKGD